MIYTQIYQGTTPFIKFPLEYAKDDIEKIKITFLQSNKIVFTKTKADCYFDKDENWLFLSLTQEETYSLDADKGLIDVALRIALKNHFVTIKQYTIQVINNYDKEIL